MKSNCWQVKGCGREPGGAKVSELGVCPAATDDRLSGVHHGLNGGRTCWVVAGTYCGGNVQGCYASKLVNCMTCEFYEQVKKEEGSNFVAPTDLLKKIA